MKLAINKQDFTQMIRDQIKNEKEANAFLLDSAKKTDNTIIRLLLYQLALDSAKHEHMLNVILQLLKPSHEEQFKCESEEFREVIEKHLRIEHGMLENFENIVDKTDDNRIRFILQDILADEKRHHAIVKRVYELICEGEKIRDEKWWDFLYRYSRLSG